MANSEENVEKLIGTTIKGLIFTAIEKVNVLGQDALEDILELMNVCSELISFYELDIDIESEFDEIIELAMEIG